MAIYRNHKFTANKQSRQRKYIDAISHFESFPTNSQSTERKNVGGHPHFSCLAAKGLSKTTFSIEGYLQKGRYPAKPRD